MTPEHLTNEELANWMVPFTAIDDRSSGYIKSVIDEAARRLRNSIPKPDMTIEQGDIMYINGTYIGIVDEQCIANIRTALGMQGGGDE